MKMRTWLVAGALLGFVGVALGSFGAHGLEKALAARGLDAEQVAERLHNWDVAVRYQMVHALVLLIVGLLAARSASRILVASGIALLAGTTVFSGCLYAYVLTGQRVLALIVPIGGGLMLLGWLLLAVAGARCSRVDQASAE
jgi:uncharacterized membrane protein YgdD (TMEM256/DUF423 family)